MFLITFWSEFYTSSFLLGRFVVNKGFRNFILCHLASFPSRNWRIHHSAAVLQMVEVSVWLLTDWHRVLVSLTEWKRWLFPATCGKIVWQSQFIWSEIRIPCQPFSKWLDLHSSGTVPVSTQWRYSTQVNWSQKRRLKATTAGSYLLIQVNTGPNPVRFNFCKSFALVLVTSGSLCWDHFTNHVYCNLVWLVILLCFHGFLDMAKKSEINHQYAEDRFEPKITSLWPHTARLQSPLPTQPLALQRQALWLYPYRLSTYLLRLITTKSNCICNRLCVCVFSTILVSNRPISSY